MTGWKKIVTCYTSLTFTSFNLEKQIFEGKDFGNGNDASFFISLLSSKCTKYFLLESYICVVFIRKFPLSSLFWLTRFICISRVDHKEQIAYWISEIISFQMVFNFSRHGKFRQAWKERIGIKSSHLTDHSSLAEVNRSNLPAPFAKFYLERISCIGGWKEFCFLVSCVPNQKGGKWFFWVNFQNDLRCGWSRAGALWFINEIEFL